MGLFDKLLRAATAFDYITPVVGIARDAATGSRAFQCNSLNDAIRTEQLLKRHKVRCYIGSTNVLNDETLVMVDPDDVDRAKGILSR